MGRPRRQTDYVAIVEACYEPIERDAEWLSALLRKAEPALDLGGGLGLSLVRETHQQRTVALSGGVGRVAEILSYSWPVIQQLDEGTYRSFYYPSRPVVLASSLVATFPTQYQQVFAALMDCARSQDLLGMLGYPARGWAFAMFVALDKGTRVRGALRETLGRLRIHIEASLRLRLCPPSAAVAIIRPDGRLAHHATRGGREQAARRELVARAKEIEATRTKAGRQDAQRALAMWRALVEGRWSLVERTDSDGRRAYHAFENAPQVRQHRALSQLESSALELSLQGLTGKEVAYAIGVSQTRVSLALASAAERLGVSSRAELMRVAAGLLGEHADVRTRALTSAEREVLLLVQRGLSNRAIAEVRKVSVRTVANQLASLLRKTGASSRRGLLLVRTENAKT